MIEIIYLKLLILILSLISLDLLAVGLILIMTKGEKKK